MICPNCHSEISDTSLFCPVCNFQFVSAAGMPNQPGQTNNSYGQSFVQSMNEGTAENANGAYVNPQADMMNDQILSGEPPYQGMPQGNMYGAQMNNGNPYGPQTDMNNGYGQQNMYGNPYGSQYTGAPQGGMNYGNPYGPQAANGYQYANIPPQGSMYGAGPQYSNMPPQGNMYGAQQMGYYPQNHVEDGKSTASLVLGILSLCTCWLPFVGIILAIISLILANASKKTTGITSNSVTVGIVLSIIGIIINAIVSIVAVIVIIGFTSW